MSDGNHSGHQGHGHFKSHNISGTGHQVPAHKTMIEMMQMTFQFGTKETLLFDFWEVDSTIGMILSCIAIFIMAFLYEGLKTLRTHLIHREHRSRYTAVRAENEMAGPTSAAPEGNIAIRSGMLGLTHIQQTGLYMVQVLLAYFLMLLFMAFNVWICLAIVWGAGLGYFVFGWYRVSVSYSVDDHCSA
ncbi:probable low affinity copper uptake protein 2 isoform X1 [Varroa jacobsoni]|nr:probable low affinity copper uptake protein 2 isoform X1 [Varroa jacobsoni]XP_022696410.1 probable low affinity copper uptake protein 2 isoform X1 [Varroa jacobsoni]XP_022696411.1 probable low affinity copper uptake protein 2 isoform X1 [Varroa jacobsoni]